MNLTKLYMTWMKLTLLYTTSMNLTLLYGTSMNLTLLYMTLMNLTLLLVIYGSTVAFGLAKPTPDQHFDGNALLQLPPDQPFMPTR